MGCGCGGKKATTWQYTSASGQVRTFSSQLQARAQQIRDGGGGSIVPITS
jgi:hypothetical protein